MVDPDRRPTAQEIEELIDLVRRDPSSPAFIDLGEAYLSLGRPRDAIQVGNLGLEASPDNLEGRVMLARAFAALHQWKEAQGELLRVVKVDRSNRQGFALLGEVLLRRSDFERAVPVLQHAQNLDPTSPQILAMLRRARAGQPLDPPNPVPQPIPPRGETDNRADLQRAAEPARPHIKPRAAPPPPPSSQPQMVPTAAPMVPTMAIEPARMERPAPSSFPEASAGFAAPAPPPRPPKQTAPPPLSVEGVRPRVIASAKPTNAAQASLRQSAAVGETYLNDLLTGGLLDVAGVRVPDADYDLRPDRRWGRSTRRAFIFLFVVLVLGIGGGGTWYWWSEKQKNEAVAQLQAESKTALGAGDYNGIVESLKKLQDALAKDKANKLSFAYYVESAGLASLLYGEAVIPSIDEPNKEVRVGAEQVDAAYKGITQREDAIVAGEPGWREMVIGKAAVELSRLPVDVKSVEQMKAAVDKLADVNKSLDDHLAKNDGDKWARWLKGRAMLAAGDRRGASAAFKTASDGDDGVVVAMIDLANLYVDDGKIDEALALFKKVLANPKAKDHPLAILGQALAKAEASIEVSETIGDLNAKFVTSKIPPRVAAYRWLAIAIASLSIEEYPSAIEAITKSTAGKPPSEPRFWARVAWVHYKLGRPPPPGATADKGDLAVAKDARLKCIWFSKKADPDPTAQLVEAGLLLAYGYPDKVLDVAAKLEGVRPRLLRTYALLDLGKAKDAQSEAEEILKGSTGATGKVCEEGNDQANIEAKILCEQARMLGSEKERTAAADAMLNLARASKSKLGRHALGIAYYTINDIPNAKEHLGQAVKDISEASPNPLEYRTRTALAEIALVTDKNIADAGKYLDQALDANSQYFPALALQAKIVLRNQEPDKALKLLAPLLKESAASLPMVQLTLAEALIVKKGSTAKDKEQAKAILVAMKDKPGVQPEELGRIAVLLDPKLPDELGVPAPEGTPGVKPPKRRPGHR